MINRFILRPVVIVIFSAMLVASGIANDAAERRLARLPSADQLPFSFEFGGRNSNDLINRIRKGPMQSGAKQLLISRADRFAKSENDGFLLRRNSENSGREKNNHQQHHHDFDDGETTS